MSATTAFRNERSVRPLSQIVAVVAFVRAVIRDALELRSRLVKRYGVCE